MYPIHPDNPNLNKAAVSLMKFCSGLDNSDSSTLNGENELAVIREESLGSSAAFEGKELLKLDSYAENHNMQQALKLVFKAAIVMNDPDLAELAVSKLSNNSCEKAINSAVFSGKLEELENFVEDSHACELLAKSHYEKKDTEKAITFAKHALEISANSYDSLMIIGQIHQNLGEMTEAMTYFLKAAECTRIEFSILPVFL